MHTVTLAAELTPYWGGIVVPTMGALHAGHRRLIEQAVSLRASRQRPGIACPIVVTIFVNPTQFTDPSDLQRYPRTLDADCRLCEGAGADVVFAPSVDVVYPEGAGVRSGGDMTEGGGKHEAEAALPEVATRPGLEDAYRPGHFAGVCQVVRRLFELTRPSVAMFGEKDWQQLQVIAAMTQQQSLPIEIVPVDTVRESDGLAMSSRNVFLNPPDRARAAAISEALREAGKFADPIAAERGMQARLRQAGLEVEYAVIRDAVTLLPVSPHAAVVHACRALIAARAGSVRLIDNACWPERSS